MAEKDKIRIAVFGAGGRGRDAYGVYLINNEKAKVTAVAEPHSGKANRFAEEHRISPENIYRNYEDFFSRKREIDAVIICTQDKDHYDPCKKALEAGYHVLLEKPISNNLEECFKLEQLASHYPEQIFMICHVLRYTGFFSEIKKIIDSGEIGKVYSVAHNENTGYFHFAHSFVRGNWRQEKASSPFILSKSCHDIDIILWLIGKSCLSVSAFGSLGHFRKEKAPENAGKYCVDCKAEETCPYSALKIYPEDKLTEWPSNIVVQENSKEALTKALETGPYGRCVYHSDNDVVDHMNVIFEFEDDVIATFNLNAFTKEVTRTIKVMGDQGEILGHAEKNSIEIRRFDEEKSRFVVPPVQGGHHGGGDQGIIDNFTHLLANHKTARCENPKTSIKNSIDSHIIAFAAEKSRKEKKVINIREFKNEVRCSII